MHSSQTQSQSQQEKKHLKVEHQEYGEEDLADVNPPLLEAEEQQLKESQASSAHLNERLMEDESSGLAASNSFGVVDKINTSGAVLKRKQTYKPYQVVENEEELTYTVIEVLDVPQGITPDQISVYIDEEDELVVQAEYPGVVELTPSDDVYGDFEVSDGIKSAIDQSMQFAKLASEKEPIFRRAIAELMTTNTSVSHTWRKYKINHITLTKYYRMANEFLKGEEPVLKKGKRQRSEVGGSVFRRVLTIPEGILKETVKCYFEPWDGRLTITAALAPEALENQEQEELVNEETQS